MDLTALARPRRLGVGIALAVLMTTVALVAPGGDAARADASRDYFVPEGESGVVTVTTVCAGGGTVTLSGIFRVADETTTTPTSILQFDTFAETQLAVPEETGHHDIPFTMAGVSSLLPGSQYVPWSLTTDTGETVATGFIFTPITYCGGSFTVTGCTMDDGQVVNVQVRLENIKSQRWVLTNNFGREPHNLVIDLGPSASLHYDILGSGWPRHSVGGSHDVHWTLTAADGASWDRITVFSPLYACGTDPSPVLSHESPATCADNEISIRLRVSNDRTSYDGSRSVTFTHAGKTWVSDLRLSSGSDTYSFYSGMYATDGGVLPPGPVTVDLRLMAHTTSDAPVIEIARLPVTVTCPAATATPTPTPSTSPTPTPTPTVSPTPVVTQEPPPPPVADAAPGVLERPRIVGPMRVGADVTCAAAFESADSVRYEWRRDGMVIGTGRSRTLLPRDLRTSLRCKAVATNSVGSNGATSGARTVALGLPPAVVARPWASGVFRPGRVVSVVVGRWSPAPDGYRFQWRRNGVPIPGARGKSYRLTRADRGATITVLVAVDAAGHRRAVIATKPRAVK